jgi:hypothetical protein
VGDDEELQALIRDLLILPWRCLANLAAAAVRGPISKIFTSTYEKFLQTAGLQDGASHCWPTVPRFFPPCMPHLTLTPLTLT